MKKFENKSNNKKGKSHRFFGVSPKIQRSSNLLFPLQARGLEGIKCILNICTCLMKLPRLRFAMTPYRHSERSEESSKINIKTWILRFAFAPLRMTMLALVLSISVISESWAACNDNLGFDCGTNCCYTKDKQNNYTFYKDPTAPENSEAAITSANNGAYGFGRFQDAKTATIMPGITSIGGNAFDRATVLSSITIPDTVTSIGYNAFAYTFALESLNIPNSVKNFDKHVFDYSGVNFIEFPNGVSTLGERFFSGISGKSSIEIIAIPDTIETLNSLAFKDMPSNTTVYCKGETTKCLNMINTHGGNVSAENVMQYPEGCTSLKKNGTCDTCANQYIFSQRTNQCIHCTDIGKVFYKNQCLDEYPFAKKHYTPTEAAQWLNEDNNTITLTFKKQ